jgi:hypothetical protein
MGREQSHTSFMKRQRQRIKRVLALLLLITVVLGAGSLMAATDGTLGTTSTGTSVVTLTIPQFYRISGVADLSLGSYSGTGTMTGNDDLCVYSNGVTTYKIRMTDDTTMTSNTFSIENAAHTKEIPMAVRWNSTTGTGGNSAVTYNTQLSGTGANTTSSDCSSGGNTANIQVSFAQADLQAASAAAYSATLTLIVEP